MEGKLDNGGALWIKRGERMKGQLCPDDSDGCHCGDYCPQFGEPEPSPMPLPGEPDRLIAGARLVICQNRVLWFTKFEDERGTDAP